MSFTTAKLCADYLDRFGTSTNDYRSLEILEGDLVTAIKYNEDWMRDVATLVDAGDDVVMDTRAELERFLALLDEVRLKMGKT